MHRIWHDVFLKFDRMIKLISSCVGVGDHSYFKITFAVKC